MTRLSAHSNPTEIDAADGYFMDDTYAAQRLRLMDVLRLGAISADDAKDHLDVINPHERIRELRLLGHAITVTLEWVNRGTASRRCVPTYRLVETAAAAPLVGVGGDA